MLRECVFKHNYSKPSAWEGLTCIIHTCFYCKGKLVAPQHDVRSSSLKVGFTTFCIVIAVLALMHNHFTFS